MNKDLNFKISLPIFIIFTMVAWLQSQIVIESNEYNIDFGTKIYLYTADDSTGDGLTVNVGTTGGPQTWNFTTEQFPNGYNQEFTVIDPSTTPYADTFPDADHVWSNAGQGDSLTVYQYFDITNSALFLDGMVLSSMDTLITSKSEPAEKVIVFPAQLNTTWNNNFAERTELSGFAYVDSTSRVSTIDAWGTINTPAGSFDCLRLREDETSITTIYLFSIPFLSDTSTYISYSWVTEQYGLIANLSSLDDEQNPNFTKASDVTFRTSVQTAIGDTPGQITESFDLLKNYPNPFNPTTTISYNLNRASEVKLTIYNAIGQEVQTLFKQHQLQGSHEITWDAGDQPSGVYFCELKADGQSSVRKMILIK